MKKKLLGQMRADYALSQVRAISSSLGSAAEKKAFVSLAASAPALILQNGLGQSLAFWASKAPKYKRYELLLNALGLWIFRDNLTAVQTLESFFTELNRKSAGEYMELQKDALHYLEWLKRYARAFMEKGKTDGKQ